MASAHLNLAAFTALQTGSLFGYSQGFIGGVLVLPSFLRHFDLYELPADALAREQSLIVLVWIIGAFFGVPLGIPICRRLGRKWCLALSGVFYVIGAGLQLVQSKGNKALVLFNVGRGLSGVGVGMGTLVSPMYISEVSPAAVRGALMSGYQTLIQISALIGFWSSFAFHSVLPDTATAQWQLPVAIQLLPGCLLLLGLVLIPETPRFWAEKGQWGNAETSLAWLRGLPNDDPRVVDEIADIRENIEKAADMASKHHESFWTEISKPGIRNRMGVGIGLMIAQNMTFLNAINYYAPTIFMSAGFTSVGASLFLSGTFGIIKLLASIGFQFFGARTRGNRFWLILGSSICFLTMLILGLLLRVLASPDRNHDRSISAPGIGCVAMIYIFTAAFGMSLGPISWNVCAEIFPLHINAQCSAITTCTQWLFMGLIAAVAPRLIAAVGWVTYIIAAVFCFLILGWVTVFVPETRGVGLGKPMDALFGYRGASHHDGDDHEQPTETTALLANEHDRRKMSLS